MDRYTVQYATLLGVSFLDISALSLRHAELKAARMLGAVVTILGVSRG